MTSANSPTWGGSTHDRFDSLLRVALVQESQLSAAIRRCVDCAPGKLRDSLKRLFVEQARQIDHWLDDLSERARRLGVVPPKPSREMASCFRRGAAPQCAVEELLDRHEAIAHELRSVVESLVSEDPDGEMPRVIDRLLEFHETSAWMLRLLLRSSEVAPRR